MILQLSDGTYLHTAYAISNIAEEFTEEDWSLTSQEGMDYIGTYIDNSSAEGTDPTLYNWEELLDTDIDDTDSEGEMPVADYQAQIDALQDQVTILQNDSEDLAGNIEVNANNVATASELGSTAQDLALEANQVAQATGQHFWSSEDLLYFLSTDTTVDTSKTYYSYDGTDYTAVTPIGTENPSTEGWYEALGAGAYVTAQTQDEFKQTPTGKNSLWNSLGMLFRSGLNYLLAILAGGADGTGPKGIAIYDGQGNTDNNIVASFTNNGSVIGKDAKTIIGSNRIIMLNEEGVGLFEAAGTGQSISQRVSEYYGIMLTHTMTLDYTIFTKGIPPQGTEFNIEYDYGGPSPKQPAFTVGVWKSYDFEYPDINTIEIIYDGAQTISISYEKLMPYWGNAEIVGLSYTLTSDAPSFTLGNRALDSEKGAYSLAAGNGLIASSNYQTVLGKYNQEKANTLLVLGNGTDDNNRANVLEVDTQGNLTANNHVVGIVETGTTSNNWDYRLWSDGIYEAWRSHGFTGMALTSSSAGTYYGGGTTLGVPIFPNNGNTGVTQCLCTENNAFSHSSGVYLYQVLHSSATTATADMTFQFRAHASVSNAACGIDIYLRGTYT